MVTASGESASLAPVSAAGPTEILGAASDEPVAGPAERSLALGWTGLITHEPNRLSPDVVCGVVQLLDAVAILLAGAGAFGVYLGLMRGGVSDYPRHYLAVVLAA